MSDHDERDLLEAIESMPEQFQECRLGDHRWKRQGAPMAEGGGLYVIRWRCPGCRGKRFDRVTRSGTLYARWYKMPEGYGVRGFGHASRRKAPYRRVLLDRTEETG